ncbi:hypothetical protein KCU95_g5595, partial [Aureobasidium melanogenum]
MSTISKDTASTTTSALTEKPSEDEMIVSYTRHRRSAADVTYTYQFPLAQVTPADTKEIFLMRLRYLLSDSLDTFGSTHSVVWRMSETNQIAFVRSQSSFEAAVLDHKNANKKIIQLFVVKNDNITDLPKLDCA